MTTVIDKTCDVFISHAAVDGQVAMEIAESLESVGLKTFQAGTVPREMDLGDAIWDALAECRALIAIISPDVPSPAMRMVEIGAAATWNKPVYLVINGPSSTRLPPALARYPVYPIGRLEDVIQAIRTGFDPLTDDEQNTLVNIYRDLGTPADELSQFPQALRQLTSNFNRLADKQYSSERLLSELIRIRKQGRLPRLQTRT